MPRRWYGGTLSDGYRERRRWQDLSAACTFCVTWSSHQQASAAAAPRDALGDVPTVLAALRLADENARKKLVAAHQLMQIHLPDPSTQTILFAPVKTNILEVCLAHAAGWTDRWTRWS